MAKPVPQFSAEIFPSETPGGVMRLEQTVRVLRTLGPDFVSVTYGAGGGTRGASQAAVARVRAEGLVAVPHLSALGANRQDMRRALGTFRDDGVRTGDIAFGRPTVGTTGMADASHHPYPNRVVIVVSLAVQDGKNGRAGSQVVE